ncbi:MAG: type VI secretion system membrane subunit TssM, partial [Gammaproteobacteria bacterium]|nr:type VI secretion system membrane subunit TssM [Gammaproteobacteria bacterium]
PVYVMFTKSDLVAGFTEFFDDLGKEERNQVWGMTFPLDGQPGYALFDEEFDLLLARLNDRLTTRLNTERDTQRRGLIYGFPQQMASMREAMSAFVNETFRGSRFENALMLRGVYFTSGTQEGTPIDRIMGSLGRAFGMDYSALASFGGQGRSYFITSLLREVVFGEQALVGANRRFERQRAWMQRGAYALAFLATIGGALAWSTSFTRNQGGIGQLQEALDNYDKLNSEQIPANTDFAVILPRLNSLREITRVYGQYEQSGVPLTMGLGLYQGDMLGAGAEGAYRRELNRLLGSRIAARVAEQIATTGDIDFRYEALKLYLMMADPERLDPDLLRLWMKVDWRRSFPEAVDKQGDLQEHLDALITAGIEPAPVDHELIQSVRLGLGQVPLAQLAYGRLKREAAGSDTPPFKLVDVLGPDGSRVFVRASGKPLDEAIPGLFTYRGYFETYQTESSRLVDQLRKESWVLDVGSDDLSKAELDKLDQDVETLYLDEYGELWQSMLMDLRLAPINSVAEAAKVAEVLSSTRSPMRTLLQAVERNTSLDKLPA